MTVQLWFTNHTSAQPECYFWCTEDGKLPEIYREYGSVTEDVFDLLVRLRIGYRHGEDVLTCLFLFKANGTYEPEDIDLNAESDDEPEPMASHKIYSLDVQYPSSTTPFSSNNEDSIINLSKTFTWLHDTPCPLNIVCTGLDSNAGSTYGIKYFLNDDAGIIAILTTNGYFQNKVRIFSDR